MLAPVPSSNLIVPTPAIPVLPLIDLATLELPADQQEPTELTLFGLKKSALDPSLVGFQDLEIRHGASEQVNDSLLSEESSPFSSIPAAPVYPPPGGEGPIEAATRWRTG